VRFPSPIARQIGGAPEDHFAPGTSSWCLVLRGHYFCGTEAFRTGFQLDPKKAMERTMIEHIAALMRG
jgi:hypothetical protein